MDAPFEADRAKPSVPHRGQVTARQLFAEHAADTSARIVSSTRRELAVCGTTVATLGPDPALVTPLCATSATGMPVVEVLAAVASQHPTGVLVLETADSLKGFAFEVVNGRVTGARGPGPLDRLESWVAEVHRRYPDRFEDAAPSSDSPAWSGIAREFVYERVLDHLELARETGSRMTFIRGDVDWVGAKLGADEGPTLDHLLLEHARRWDEFPAIERRLGDQSRLVVPLSEPPAKPTSRPNKSGSEWDFFDDPDPAALAEWRDALWVWRICDGESTIEEIAANALLGGFRGLAAISVLGRGEYVVFVDHPAAKETAAPVQVLPTHSDSGRPIAPVIPLRAPSPSARKTPLVTEYAMKPRKPDRVSAKRPSRRHARPQPVRGSLAPRTPNPIVASRASASATGGHVPVSHASASSSFPRPPSRGLNPTRRKIQVHRRVARTEGVSEASGTLAIPDPAETVRAPARAEHQAPTAPTAKRRNWLNVIVVVLGLIAFGTGAGVAIKLHLRNADSATSHP